MQATSHNMTIFLTIALLLITTMMSFFVTIVFLYRKRQLQFEKNLVQTKLDHEKAILISQVEIQEQTFQHISREIHDNISLNLTLAKLNLHTFNWEEREKSGLRIETSIELLSQSITQLNDLSKSLDADIINRHSLLKALEEEIQRIRRTGYLRVEFEPAGTPVYLESQTELVIFRIIQEAFNNILKHAGASQSILKLYYADDHLEVSVEDNGNGFDPGISQQGPHAGLKNMESRVRLLGGEMKIKSCPGYGSLLEFKIPFNII